MPAVAVSDMRVVLSRMWRATNQQPNGLAFATRSEQAFREEIVALCLAVAACGS